MKPFIVGGEPKSFNEERRWFMRLLNGHLCPVCGEQIMDIESMQIAYHISPCPTNIEKYGHTMLFCKKNYTIVCERRVCLGRVQWHFYQPVEFENKLEQLREYLRGTNRGRGLVSRIKKKKGDGYREVVMKKCGIDPVVNQGFRVYRSSIEGSFREIITVSEWLNAQP